MKNSLYAIYDRKAEYYLPVFPARGDAEAWRMFTETVVKSETPISQYPADFDLVRVATINLETGVVTPEHMPTLLVNGLAALTEAQRQRSRYQTVLGTVSEEEPLHEAS